MSGAAATTYARSPLGAIYARVLPRQFRESAVRCCCCCVSFFFFWYLGCTLIAVRTLIEKTSFFFSREAAVVNVLREVIFRYGCVLEFEYSLDAGRVADSDFHLREENQRSCGIPREVGYRIAHSDQFFTSRARPSTSADERRRNRCISNEFH